MLATVGQTVVVRELPADEWDRLQALPFGARGLPDPAFAHVLVAETASGEIVGLWAAMLAVQLDGLWIAEPYRGTHRIAHRLLQTMKTLLSSLGIRRSYTYVETDDVLMLALKAGFVRLRADLLVLDTPLPEGDPSCP